MSAWLHLRETLQWSFQRLHEASGDAMVLGLLAALFFALLATYESILMDGARLVILGRLMAHDLDDKGRQTLLWASCTFMAVYFVLAGGCQSLLPILPSSVATNCDDVLGNLTWRKLWENKDELFIYLSATALLRESFTKVVHYMIDDRKIPECRVRGLAVMCINEGAADTDTSLADWLREAGGAWTAKVIAVEHQKASQPMEWFPDIQTRLHVGDVVFLSCEDTVRFGYEDSESDAMKLALYLANNDKQLVRKVELACSPLVESLPDWLCGLEGVKLGPPCSNLGGLNFRKISGGITLAAIVHKGEPKWFPGPNDLVKSDDRLLVVTALLRDGAIMYQQSLPELREHLQARLLDKEFFEALGGRLPFESQKLPLESGAKTPKRLLRHAHTSLTFGPLRS